MYQNGTMYGGMGMGGMASGMGGMGMGMGMPQQSAFGAGRTMGGMGSMAMGGMGGMVRGVGRSMGSEEGGQPSRREEFVQGKLFLGGLDNATTKDTLLDYCRQWGDVSDYVLMEGRGFGFVTFADPTHAQAFLETRQHVIDGKKVEAKAAVPRNSGSGNSLTKKMFVGGTGDIADEEFSNYFSQFGEIEDCVILRKPDGGSRGFGFVTYKDEMSVEKCLVMSHTLSGKTVELKRAVKKEDMSGSGGMGMGGMGMGGGGYGMGGGAGGPVRGNKQPDWMCKDCGNKNFGWREICNRCQIPKPAGGGMEVAKDGKQPDWMCPDCANKNFGWREVCNRCQNPKPAGAKPVSVNMGGGRMGGFNRGAGGMGGGFDNGMGSMAEMSTMGGMGNMGMGGMGAMGGYGMGAMGYGMGGMGGMQGMGAGMGAGMGTGYGAASGYGGQAGFGNSAQAGGYGMQQSGASGYGQQAQGGFGGGAGAYGQQGGYGRQAGRGGTAGATNRYRPY